MLPTRFCNYYTDYQQRLGFLKILASVGEGVRGGRDEYVERLRTLYRPRGLKRAEGKPFNATELLEREEIPSWQPGFPQQDPEKYLGRLVEWGEMCGIIAANGRLSEWARILLLLNDDAAPATNPFLLSPLERAFFLQLLLVHDQVLHGLVIRLSARALSKPFGVRDSCLETLEVLGDFADTIQGQGIEAVQLRVELRILFERIARTWRLDRTALTSSARRAETLAQLRRPGARKQRNRWIEYHAICRFEQLTDLGFLIKEPPSKPASSSKERRDIRTGWAWYVAPGLTRVSELLRAGGDDIAAILVRGWMQLCDIGFGLELRTEGSLQKLEIVELLDHVLPKARRQLGPVQVHSWAMLACLEAARRGRRLEIRDVYDLLDQLRLDPIEGNVIRQGGRLDFLGRTAVVPRDGLRSHFGVRGRDARGSDHAP
jgi:hypothetical protein